MVEFIGPLFFCEYYSVICFVLFLISSVFNVWFLCNFSGPWKKKNLSEFGIVTQCIAPTRVNDQYLTNVLLKINAKVLVAE